MASDMKISPGSLRTIVKRDLDLSSFQEKAGPLPFSIYSGEETSKKQRTSEPIRYCGARKSRVL